MRGTRGLVALSALLCTSEALQLPSCEDETNAHCIREGLDLSAEGISACLEKLTAKSESCSTYLKMMSACEADLSDGGVCFSAKMDGDAVPCLVQRVKPEDLTEACNAAVPREELKGLAKFWKDGKRELHINEISDLNADDKDTYTRWQKKKKGKKKTDKDRERDYAVKAAKRERVESLISAAVVDAKPSSLEEATKVAKAEAAKALDEDMTNTLKPFTKAEIAKLAKAAFKSLKSEL